MPVEEEFCLRQQEWNVELGEYVVEPAGSFEIFEAILHAWALDTEEEAPSTFEVLEQYFQLTLDNEDET